MLPPASPPPIHTPALIIGAGPVGLFQVFELGLLGISAHVVDARSSVGGQPAELYPDKPIYDIPAVPVCTGRELTQALLQQIAPFHATFHLGQHVHTVQPQPDGRWCVQTTANQTFLTRTIFIAAGVGAFLPRPLPVNGMAAFEGTQLFYQRPDAARLAGQRVVIAGGGDNALTTVLDLLEATPPASRPASVTLLHRRNGFRAAADSVARMHALCDGGHMQFVVGQITGFDAAQERLHAIKVTSPDGVTRTLALDTLLVCFGLSPKLGPIADWGLELHRRQIAVDTEKFQTSAAGIYAVGDINTYPGKKKLILCGFHECTLAAFAAAAYLTPEQPAPLLQYTTTSPKLHQALGVATPPTPQA